MRKLGRKTRIALSNEHKKSKIEWRKPFALTYDQTSYKLNCFVVSTNEADEHLEKNLVNQGRFES